MQIELTGTNEALVRQMIEQLGYQSAEEVIADLLADRRVELDSANPPVAEETNGNIDQSESELGQTLRAIRERFLHSGGSVLNVDEIDQELADRRGERDRSL